MSVKTYDIRIWFRNISNGPYYRDYYNLSRAAVKRYIEYHKDNSDFWYAVDMGYGSVQA